MELDFCARLGHPPSTRFAFLIDGATYMVDRCACETLHEPPPGIPEWLDQAQKEWPSPPDPITFSGVVREGRGDEAMEFLFG